MNVQMLEELMDQESDVIYREEDSPISTSSTQIKIVSDMKNAAQGKLQKCRERNREHARKTRLRKKAHLESLKSKLSELQKEAAQLSMKMEESNTANILLCLGGSVQQEPENDKLNLKLTSSSAAAPIAAPPEIWKGNLVEYIRNVVRTEAVQGRNLEQATAPDTSSKTSSDNGDAKTDKERTDSNSDIGSDNGFEDAEFAPEQGLDKLPCELGSGGKNVDMDGLRKERNRMHAKLTRDRKKLFTSHVQQMIKSLERQNSFMRNRLEGMEKAVGGSISDGQEPIPSNDF